MTRRSLLRRVVLLLGIGPPGLMGCLSGRAAVPLARTGPLSADEMAGLLAFGEVLVEGRTLPQAERGYLAGFIEDRTARSPLSLSLYRKAAGTLDRLAGGAFARLPVSQRSDLVARHGLADWQAPPGEEPGPLPAAVRELRTRAVPDLIRGYYSSPAGWAVVGYASFPGRCGDPTRYTRADP